MYTLLTKSKLTCCGLFPTEHDARAWAATFLPHLELEPIMLMTNATDVEYEWDAGAISMPEASMTVN